MSISVTPSIPVAAAQGAAPALVLQPGMVVDAQVLAILSADLVRIAINSLSIDVLSEVPLQAGQSLRLAVSQTQDGVRLAVVGQAADAPASLFPDSVTLAPGATIASDALADTPAHASIVATASPGNALTPLEKLAVATATQTAATQQASLAPLFANLGVVAASGSLPPALQQAVAQVLARQTNLDQNLSGDDVKNAFQSSGLFLEAALASGSILSTTGMPDLKAALIVLRQTLVASLGATEAAGSPVATATVAQQPVSAPAPAPTPAPSSFPEIDVREIFLPQARLPAADAAVELDSTGRIVLTATPPQAGPGAATIGAALNLLQEALQEMPRDLGSAPLAPGAPQTPGSDDVTVHTNTPPPPFRGALPSAQPIASPSIASSAPLAASAHQLLDDTDAAIARQTLLQVASLPDRIDTTGPQAGPAAPRWSFEIPFATPQGTAVTQFEISRDGGGGGAETAKRVWRARFSLDIEPAGPVHALVSLSGDKTSVRMWAERPATAARLRAGSAQLSQALSNAELKPGDIVIRDGAPPQAAPAPAGHFLDRAL
ncbi:MAG: flagellar hook-length control protein FliK [Bradyrhizobium sp.]|uniref:flagellar hook-length control protein FliK n=1 Tax=Bradyrhizobium sp. TaxID=376 RepID=UPI00121DF774|nr:flagellar hook-length control protein FliK [Bradyrhizobium sp.]THD70726.1 MAG: flagellar hook-length control protein FliK [Bradyrhizobium sp.]